MLKHTHYALKAILDGLQSVLNKEWGQKNGPYFRNFLLYCFAQLLKLILILNFFSLLIRPPIALQGNSLSAVSVSSTFDSTFRITLTN